MLPPTVHPDAYSTSWASKNYHVMLITTLTDSFLQFTAGPMATTNLCVIISLTISGIVLSIGAIQLFRVTCCCPRDRKERQLVPRASDHTDNRDVQIAQLQLQLARLEREVCMASAEGTAALKDWRGDLWSFYERPTSFSGKLPTSCTWLK